MAKKLEKLSQGLNVTSKGIGNESKFGLGKSKGVAKPAAGVRNSTTISEQNEASHDKTQMSLTLKLEGDQTGKNQDQSHKKKDKTSAGVAEAALAKLKKNEDKTFSLSEDEFTSIGWDKDWPMIIQDLAFYFTD